MAPEPDPQLTPNRTVGWSVRELDDKFESLEQFLEERDRRYEERFKSMDERDKRYDERALAQKEAISAALSAAEKATSAAFAASEKAVLKAEDAQRGYNASTNEFRGQLKDQNDTMMPRAEAMSALSDIRERIDRAAHERQGQIEAIKADLRSSVEAVRAEIVSLRESRSEGSGRLRQQQQAAAANQWTITAIIGAAALLVGLFSSGMLSKTPPAAIVTPAAPPVIIVQPSLPAPNAAVREPTGSATDTKSTTKAQ
jgi:chromosome segregation ATPase